MKKHLSKILFLIIGLSLAATASYLNAWTEPTQTAPEGNVAAPLNTSTASQAKNAYTLVGSTLNIGGILSSDQLLAFTRVSAGEYCDVNGENCSSSTGGGSSVPAGTVAAFNLATCPAGWIPADGRPGTQDLRGYFIRGSGTNSDGTASGAFGIKQADEFKSHDHKDVYGRSTNTEWDWVSTNGGGTNFLAPRSFDSTWIVGDSAGPWTQINAQRGTETRPKNVALLYCQKDLSSSGGGSSSSSVLSSGENAQDVQDYTYNITLTDAGTLSFSMSCGNYSSINTVADSTLLVDSVSVAYDRGSATCSICGSYSSATAQKSLSAGAHTLVSKCEVSGRNGHKSSYVVVK